MKQKVRQQLNKNCTAFSADHDPENYPEEYFLEIPAEVSVHYMADPDGIRSRSTAALEVLKENQDFQYLRSKLSGDLDKETRNIHSSVASTMSDFIKEVDEPLKEVDRELKAEPVMEVTIPVPPQKSNIISPQGNAPAPEEGIAKNEPLETEN